MQKASCVSSLLNKQTNKQTKIRELTLKCLSLMNIDWYSNNFFSKKISHNYCCYCILYEEVKTTEKCLIPFSEDLMVFKYDWH